MNRIMLGTIGMAIAITVSTAPASGRPGEEPLIVEGKVLPRAYVPYGDLNLASAEGIGILNARVSRAATNLCTDPGVMPLSWVLASRACVRSAIAGADGQIRDAIADFGKMHYAANRRITVAAR